jgi:hypothetical protein
LALSGNFKIISKIKFKKINIYFIPNLLIKKNLRFLEGFLICNIA